MMTRTEVNSSEYTRFFCVSANLVSSAQLFYLAELFQHQSSNLDTGESASSLTNNQLSQTHGGRGGKLKWSFDRWYSADIIPAHN